MFALAASSSYASPQKDIATLNVTEGALRNVRFSRRFCHNTTTTFNNFQDAKNQAEAQKLKGDCLLETVYLHGLIPIFFWF